MMATMTEDVLVSLDKKLKEPETDLALAVLLAQAHVVIQRLQLEKENLENDLQDMAEKHTLACMENVERQHREGDLGMELDALKGMKVDEEFIAEVAAQVDEPPSCWDEVETTELCEGILAVAARLAFKRSRSL